jgi:hypothetical protein
MMSDRQRQSDGWNMSANSSLSGEATLRTIVLEKWHKLYGTGAGQIISIAGCDVKTYARRVSCLALVPDATAFT